MVIKQFGESLPVTDLFGLSGYESADFSVQKKGALEVVFSLERGEETLVKTYRLRDNDYLIEAAVQITNNSGSVTVSPPSVNSFTLDISRLDKKAIAGRDKSLLEYSIATEGKDYRKANAYKISDKELKEVQKSVLWTGFRDRYFCFVFKPLFVNKGFDLVRQGEDRMRIRLLNGGEAIPPGQTQEISAEMYFGPQNLALLKTYGRGFENIMKYSNIGLFDFVAKLMSKVMHLLHRFIPSWGICIVLTALFVYGAMYPLSIKGMASMKKMQSLQPEINRIKEKYKDNPQRLQKETMELYKENKINPLGGCLPLLLQMPFFLGVYQLLWRSVEFKGTSFLWIKDLSQPDRLFILPVSLPIIGDNFNILPILMIFIMFFQQRFSTKNMVVTDPAQASSQKMMTTFFPVMIGFIFYNIASGLALYFTTFYLLSTFTQWKMSRVS